jgi:hypothetical protein
MELPAWRDGSIMKPPARGLAETRQEESGCHMNRDDVPAPEDGFVVTHFLVVADQDRSRDFYQRLFDGQVVLERDPDGHLIEVGQTTGILS